MFILPFISAILLVTISFATFGHAQITCPDTLTEVLTLIYDEMGGANWTTNTWFSNSDPCTWTGIECNHNGDVIYMDLSSMNLTGNISSAFECLPYLKSLYLNNNDLSGSIPTALCELSNLSYLQIRASGLTGEVPTCLCNLANVMFMYFSDNALTGTIPVCLSTLSYLRELHLDCNDLSGSVPTGFANQASLEELWVNCNTSLTCTTLSDTFIYKCGDVDCDQCGLTPGNCPTYTEVEDCGRYYPQTTNTTDTDTVIVSSSRRPQLC